MSEKKIADTNETKKQKKTKGASLKDFVDFFKKNSAIGLAIGVVMADAVNRLVTAVVKGLVEPLIGLLFTEDDFSNFNVQIGGSTLKFGAVLSGFIYLLSVSVIIYVLVKGLLRNESLLSYTTVKKAKLKKAS